MFLTLVLIEQIIYYLQIQQLKNTDPPYVPSGRRLHSSKGLPMRQLTILLSVCCLLISCATTKTTNENSNSLDGNWVPVNQELAGKALPKTVFENQKLIMKDSTYTLIAESIDKGIVEYRDDRMDIYGKEGVNTGKHFTAIYKFENDQLTICYNLAGDGYPESFETAGKPVYFLSVFKREPAK